MSLMEQMANIGSEVGRAGKWLAKGKTQLAEGALFRGLDLIDVTIKVGRRNLPTRSCLLEELCRGRELLATAFLEKDFATLEYLDKYFGQFAAAIRR